FWGDGTREQRSQYQIAMYSDGQRFSDNAKEVGAAELPSPSAGILPGSEWSDILSLVTRVRLEYMGASSHSGEPRHIFSFRDSASDQTCRFRQRTTMLFGHKDAEDYVACEGIVASDNHLNVLGITLHLSPHAGAVSEWRGLIRYGLIKLNESGEPYLLPQNMD